jgi:LEA14-like dessication related protein
MRQEMKLKCIKGFHCFNYTLYLIFSVFVGCSGLKSLVEAPKVDLSQVRISNLSGSYADLEIMLEVFNPNKIDFDVKNLNYALDINSKTFTSGTMKEKVLVKGLEKTQVRLPIRVAYKDIVSSMLMLLKKDGLPYKVKGSAEIGPFMVPFDDVGNLTSKDL